MGIKIIYVICPVTNVTEDELKEMNEYVARLDAEGHKVMFPHRDVDQNDPTGVMLVGTEIMQMKIADEIHIFWNRNSKGSHFDLGVAMGFGKKLVLVKSFVDDIEGRSYEKIIRHYEMKDRFNFWNFLGA